MQKSELIEYLQTALQLESTVYQQQLAEQSIAEKLDSLHIDVTIALPHIEQEIYTPIVAEGLFAKTNSTFWKIAAGAVGGLSLVIWWNTPGALRDGSGGMGTLIISYVMVFLGLITLMLAVSCLMVICKRQRNKRRQEAVEKRNAERKFSIQNQYEMAIEEQHQQQMKAMAVRKELNNARRQIADNIAQLKATLEQHYRRNLLYPTYRNLIAVAQILEYLQSGVAEKLEGADGAYAQYLLDVRNNRICSRLENISQQLQLVIKNQYRLSQQLQHLKPAIDELRSTLALSDQRLKQISFELKELQRAALSVEEYMQNALPKLQRLTETVDIAAFNSRVIALNQYRQATIDNYWLEYPI